MTYILIGPGIRDNVTFENLFPTRTVEQTSPTQPIKPVEESPERGYEDATHPQPRREAAAQAYLEAEHAGEQRVAAVFARQIMNSPVVTVTESQSISGAWTNMLARNFRHLPVVNEETGQLVGMLSEHDFVQNAENLGGLPPRDYVDSEIQFVRDLMSNPILSATEDTEIHELSRVMYDRHIGAMPVLNEEGDLTGIITHRDIMKALIKTAPLELWI
ncbi:MAG: CBS domain-containing protein [Gammaproteobacteria bacterium]|nr:CBS domain-containing protein [Gammaproteobacteria bacterium]